MADSSEDLGNIDPNKYVAPVPYDEEDRVVVGLVGENDIFTASELREIIRAQIDREDIAALVFDLSRCTYVDSSVLATFLDTRRQAEELGKKVLLRNVEHANVLNTLKITGLDSVFEFEEPEKE